MLGYLRRNAVALLALFVALGGTSVAAVGTITSEDIVDGQVKTPDLGASAVTSSKIADSSVNTDDLHGDSVGTNKVKADTLTGADINESTLGRVPDAGRLGGVDAADFRPGSATASQRTDTCAQTGVWRLCAPVTLTVPSGKYYRVDVNTSMTAWGVASGVGLFCAAYEGPACLNAHPSGFTLVPGQYMNVTHNGSGYFGAGTHTFGMAARFDVPIATGEETAYTTTTIRWHSYDAEFAAGTRARTKVRSRPNVLAP